jgi:hypothetical protein
MPSLFDVLLHVCRLRILQGLVLHAASNTRPRLSPLYQRLHRHLDPRVIKSKLPKPLTTGQLHQAQVTRVDDTNTDANLKTQKDPFKGLKNLIGGGDQAPSGGGAVNIGCFSKPRSRRFRHL